MDLGVRGIIFCISVPKAFDRGAFRGIAMVDEKSAKAAGCCSVTRSLAKGHSPQIQAAERFNAALLGWLTQPTTGGSTIR